MKELPLLVVLVILWLAIGIFLMLTGCRTNGPVPDLFPPMTPREIGAEIYDDDDPFEFIYDLEAAE